MGKKGSWAYPIVFSAASWSECYKHSLITTMMALEMVGGLKKKFAHGNVNVLCESQLSVMCGETFEIQVVVDCPPTPVFLAVKLLAVVSHCFLNLLIAAALFYLN